MSQSQQTLSARTYLKMGIEVGPLILFFATYVLAPKFGVEAGRALYPATAVFMGAMALALFGSWRLEGKIAPMLFVSGGLVLVMGGLTLLLENKTFIYMKPTLTNGLFSATLLTGLLFGRPLLKPIFQAAFPPIEDKGWKRLSRNWGLFFLSLAVINEIMWRNFSEEIWVAYKTWGVFPLTIVFMASQYPVMKNHYARQPAE